MEPKTWYLISKEDADKIRAALRKLVEFGYGTEFIASSALYTLDTGLHTTDAVPGDWQGDADEADR